MPLKSGASPICGEWRAGRVHAGDGRAGRPTCPRGRPAGTLGVPRHAAGHARRFRDGWYARAIRSRAGPLKASAREPKGCLPAIPSHCRFPPHTSFPAGINNKAKLIKPMACGFRDDAYSFLKIRQAFPGVRR